MDIGENPPESLEEAFTALVDNVRLNGMSGKVWNGWKLYCKVTNLFSAFVSARASPLMYLPCAYDWKAASERFESKSVAIRPSRDAFWTSVCRDLRRWILYRRCRQRSGKLFCFSCQKGSKVKFRVAVDLRPVNAATMKEARPTHMPHLESELSDFAGSKCFASLDFASGYWQLPLHPDFYSTCDIFTPKGFWRLCVCYPDWLTRRHIFRVHVLDCSRTAFQQHSR